MILSSAGSDKSSRLGLSDLRNEQAAILQEMESMNSTFSPSIKDRAQAATEAAEAVYSLRPTTSMDTPVGVAALQVRTNALNAELEFHKDLLNQLLTPKGKPSSKSIRNNNHPSTATTNDTSHPVPESVRRGTYWGTYTPQQLQKQHGPTSPFILDTKTGESNNSSRVNSTRIRELSPPPNAPSTTTTPLNNIGGSTIPTVGDAYGSLLSELQAVKQQVSRFVESANVSPLSHLRMPNNHYRSNNSDHLNDRFDEDNEGNHERYDSESHSNDMNARRIAKQSRNKAMKKYRSLLLEEREKIIDDLESRISKAAMRSSRDVLRNSRLGPREIDALQKASRNIRRTKQQKIAEDCFIEVHSALRSMRDELDQEKRKAEIELRNTFHEDRDSMIHEMKVAIAKEKDEHISRLVNELSDTKRLALEHQREKMNESLQLEVQDMKIRLSEEHTPALQALREGALEKRTEVRRMGSVF
jgi:hypothetical protein